MTANVIYGYLVAHKHRTARATPKCLQMYWPYYWGRAHGLHGFLKILSFGNFGYNASHVTSDLRKNQILISSHISLLPAFTRWAHDGPASSRLRLGGGLDESRSLSGILVGRTIKLLSQSHSFLHERFAGIKCSSKRGILPQHIIVSPSHDNVCQCMTLSRSVSMTCWPLQEAAST